MNKVKIYHNIQAFINARNAYQQTPGMIKNGRMYVLCKGEWMPKKEWDKHNPKPVYEPQPRCNPDGTHIPSGVMVESK